MDKKHIIEILNNFPEKTIFVVGDIIMDQYIWGRVTRISPEAPVPVVDMEEESFLLGGAANVLNNIISLGSKALICGVVGHDDTGRKVIHELRVRGIDTGGIIVDSNRPTTIKTRIIAHSQQVVRYDREKRDEINHNSREIIKEYLKNRLSEIDALIISDYCKGVITKELVSEIVSLVNSKGLPIVADPKVGHFDLYKGITLITPNTLEASDGSGVYIYDNKSLEMAGKALIEKLGCKATLITRGEEGMTLIEDNRDITYIPAVAKKVFDVTGAGDTVIGVMALAIAAGATLKEAAIIANHAAGIVVGKVGTAVIGMEELKISLQID
ncbi:MAG: D-glycero-beta-D-manno-heptose-7-phosphate kinase [Nitrospirae bacterium]|nr:D-glycero-beta-D-manno-heptose-7-phosphate kinase [Nitrospirota bacterium]